MEQERKAWASDVGNEEWEFRAPYFPAQAAAEHGIELEVVKYYEAKRGFVLLRRRWVVERSFAWAARFRRLARDDERLTAPLATYHWLAFVSLILNFIFPNKLRATSNQAYKTEPNMIKRYMFTLLATLLFTQTGIAQSTDTFTDSRDGQTYKTFSFKNALTGTTVTWMAQNLNYKVQGSYAYDDKESNREELGLLYTWEAARKGCPKGWHLATDSEWSMLVTQFGGTDKAGEALKSVTGWIENGNGTNSSGFNALPAGIRRNNGYEVLGAIGFWWTSTPTGEEGKAWGWNLSYGGPGEKPLKTKAFRFDGPVSHAKSVRCVRD